MKRVSLRQFTVQGRHSVEAAARIAGDPMNHDVISMFGNDNVHWYGIVIDNRAGQRKVPKFVYIKSLTISYNYNQADAIVRLNWNVALQPNSNKS